MIYPPNPIYTGMQYDMIRELVFSSSVQVMCLHVDKDAFNLTKTTSKEQNKCMCSHGLDIHCINLICIVLLKARCPRLPIPEIVLV